MFTRKQDTAEAAASPPNFRDINGRKVMCFIIENINIYYFPIVIIILYLMHMSP